MKCILCDRCNQVIENPRRVRVLTCARPFDSQRESPSRKTHVPPPPYPTPYHGNDPRMNDIFWEKELCGNCLDDLEAFLENVPDTSHKDPVEPDASESPDAGGSASPTNPGEDNDESTV